MTRTIVVWLLTAWAALGTFMTIALIGHEREPIKPSTAVVSLVCSALMIWGVWYLWR